MQRALEGTRVIEIAGSVAANMAGHVLCGLGAEVVKIERPVEGDPIRHTGPFPGDQPHLEKSGLFLYLNHDKRSVTLDLLSADGRGVLDGLLAQADVLVVDLPPKEKRRRRLSYTSARKANAGIVMASLTPFGDHGPYKDWEATDFTVAGLGGWLFVSGEPSGHPLRTSSQMLVEGAHGVMGAVGIVAALFNQGINGKGQHIEVAEMEALVSMNRFHETTYDYLGYITPRMGSRLSRTYPYTILPCKDGYVAVICITDDQWERLCAMIGKPELFDDPRFSDNIRREKNSENLRKILEEWLAPQGKSDVFHMAQEWRLPFGIVSDAADVFALEQNKAREFFHEVEHPVAGRFMYPGAPFKMSESPWVIEHGAPLLGQDNESIYCGELGMSRAEMKALAGKGVI